MQIWLDSLNGIFLPLFLQWFHRISNWMIDKSLSTLWSACSPTNQLRKIPGYKLYNRKDFADIYNTHENKTLNYNFRIKIGIISAPWVCRGGKCWTSAGGIRACDSRLVFWLITSAAALIGPLIPLVVGKQSKTQTFLHLFPIGWDISRPPQSYVSSAAPCPLGGRPLPGPRRPADTFAL